MTVAQYPFQVVLQVSLQRLYSLLLHFSGPLDCFSQSLFHIIPFSGDHRLRHLGCHHPFLPPALASDRTGPKAVYRSGEYLHPRSSHVMPSLSSHHRSTVNSPTSGYTSLPFVPRSLPLTSRQRWLFVSRPFSVVPHRPRPPSLPHARLFAMLIEFSCLPT